MKVLLELMSISENPLFELEIELPCDDLYKITGYNEDELDGWYVMECYSSNCVNFKGDVIDIKEVNKAVMEYNRLLSWEQDLVLDLYYNSTDRSFKDFSKSLWEYPHYEVFSEPNLKRTKILVGQYFLNTISADIAEKVCMENTLDEETALKFFQIGILSGKIQYVNRKCKRYIVQDEYIMTLSDNCAYEIMKRIDDDV